jgi:hypothetical protein
MVGVDFFYSPYTDRICYDPLKRVTRYWYLTPFYVGI